MDKLLEILDKLGPILYVLVPAIAGIYFKVKKEVSKKREEIIRKDKERAEEAYSIWEHEESKKVISDIKEQCNLYKDRGHADLVHYMQLENGTVATSKIQNMFMTCLAEDNRYGNLPKQIKHLQRVPYSECSTWISMMTSDPDKRKQILLTPTMNNADYNERFIEGDHRTIHSSICAPVYDPNELFVGVVAFYYCEEDYCGREESETESIKMFRNSIENILYTYYIHRRDKKKELGLLEE